MGGTSLHPNTRAAVDVAGVAHDWCVKTHINKSSKRLLAELDVQSELRSAGLSVIPEVVACLDGLSYCSANLRLYSAHVFLSADPAVYWLDSNQWTTGHCAAAGQLLAKFHQMSSKIDAELLEELPPLSSDALYSSLESAFDAACAEEPDELIQSIVAKRQAVEGNGKHLLELSGTGRPILLHGDYHAGNLLFKGDEAVGLVDFDYMHTGFAQCDIGYGALMFAGRWGQAQGGFIDNERLGSFIDAYNKEAFSYPEPVIPAPILLDAPLAAFIQRASILVMYWMLETYACFPQTRAQLHLPLLQATFLAEQSLEPVSADVV